MLENRSRYQPLSSGTHQEPRDDLQSDMIHEFFRGFQKFSKQYVRMLQLARLVNLDIGRVEISLEEPAAFLPCLPVCHKPEQPLPSDSIDEVQCTCQRCFEDTEGTEAYSS